ncbi:hypothetical protein PAXRUDRAFT_835868, partial [Paxillus rubicundulus Ve08.2h10]
MASVNTAAGDGDVFEDVEVDAGGGEGGFIEYDNCLGTVGYGQPRLTKARTTWASQ